MLLDMFKITNNDYIILHLKKTTKLFFCIFPACDSENIFDKTFCIYVTTAHYFRISGFLHIYIRFVSNLHFQFVTTENT